MYKVVVFAAMIAAVSASASNAMGNSNESSFDSVYTKQVLLKNIESELTQQQNVMLKQISNSIIQKYNINNKMLFSALPSISGKQPLYDEK
ncbi:MAG: hypothetical protein HAW66_07770 [Shewanella sp.]|nr:hypothetical protein [Shewanella sp.]